MRSIVSVRLQQSPYFLTLTFFFVVTVPVFDDLTLKDAFAKPGFLNVSWILVVLTLQAGT